jgi:hypothetical protein
MPPYSNVLSNKLSKWESVSDVARALHFTLTARDNAPQELHKLIQMTVNVSGTSRTICNYSQNTDNLSWFQGQSNTINWSVIILIRPVLLMNIRLSVDGELLFPCY